MSTITTPNNKAETAKEREKERERYRCRCRYSCRYRYIYFRYQNSIPNQTLTKRC